jgi:hypothetical protein
MHELFNATYGYMNLPRGSLQSNIISLEHLSFLEYVDDSLACFKLAGKRNSKYTYSLSIFPT